MLVIARGAEPVFESVTCLAGTLAVSLTWSPNEIETGSMTATGAIPVPESVTPMVGCAGSLLSIFSVADRAPAKVGVKVTTIVQRPSGAGKLAPQLFV